MENEEEEGKLATSKTQRFVKDVYKGKGLGQETGPGGNAKRGGVGRRSTIVWGDTFSQLSIDYGEIHPISRENTVKCWESGDLLFFSPRHSVLNQCEKQLERRMVAVDATVHSFWLSLTRKVKVRPASASATQMKSLLTNVHKPEKTNVSKPSFSPTSLKTRRSNLRFYDPIYPVCTPTVLKQKASQPTFSTPISTYQDFSMASRGFPAMDRSKSSRKYLQRVKQARSPIPGRVLFPQIGTRAAVLSEVRLEAESPIWEVSSHASSGPIHRLPSKPRKTAKRGGRLLARGPTRLRIPQ